MFTFNKTFSEITLSDIQALISSEITENLGLEYKSEAWGRGDEDVREMLRDISSMANAHGGYFIIGMNEESDTGKAMSLKEVLNAEQERDRTFTSCLANIQTRIMGLDIKTLDIEDEKKIMLIRVPNSPKLHMITFKGLNQFWVRHDRQKSPMSIEEIKDSFIKNHDSIKKIKEFLSERRDEILEDIIDSPYYVLGAVPIILEENIFNVSDVELRAILRSLGSEMHGGYNFDNFLSHSQAHPSFHGLCVKNESFNKTSLELFRNGYFEGQIKIGDSLILPPDKEIVTDYPAILNIFIVSLAKSFLGRLKAIRDYLGYDGQCSISLSLLNIRGMGLKQYIQGRGYIKDDKIWEKPHLEIKPMTFESIEPISITKTLCDRIWQSFGYEKEPFYKEEDDDFDLR